MKLNNSITVNRSYFGHGVTLATVYY